jgi:hypothetical protein
MSMVAMLAGSQPIKGFAAAMLGLLLSFVGIDEQTGIDRWTFGSVYLWEGLPIVVVFLGLFGLPELSALLVRGAVQEHPAPPSLAGMARGIADTLREWPLVLRSSSIGAFIGAVPGIGVAVIDWIAYGQAARKPGAGPRFGQGNVRGVIAPESANNSKEGGSLIPTIAFGVPGSPSMSLLLGAFVIQGLVPGPDMLGKNASITIAMVLTIAIANILGAVTCLLLTRPLASVARVPAGILIPVVVAFIVVGSFQNNMSALDFVVLIAIGVLGMAMKELNWPRSAFSLGFVIGPTLEKYFSLSYQLSGLSWLLHPLVLVVLGFAGLNIARQTLHWWRTRKQHTMRPRALPDALLGGGVAAVAAAAFLTALRFPLLSGLFPAIAAGTLAVVSGTVAIQAAWRLRRDGSSAAFDVADLPPGEWAPSSGPILNAYLIILGTCAALAGAVLAAGHVAGTLVFLAVALLVARACRPLTAALLAIAVTLVMIGVFDVLVSQPWPRPMLAGLLDLVRH